MWSHWIFVEPQKAEENSGATKTKWRTVRVSTMAHPLMHVIPLRASLSPSKTYHSNFKISPDQSPNTQSKRNSKSRDQFDRYLCLPFLSLLCTFPSYTVTDVSFYLLSLRFMVRSVILWDVQSIINTIFFYLFIKNWFHLYSLYSKFAWTKAKTGFLIDLAASYYTYLYIEYLTIY